MNPPDPLAALPPLRTPEPVGWWPPAPGWWLLLAVAAAACALLGWRWLRRHRASAYRRQAERQLAHRYRQFQRDGDALAFVADTNALLKRAALYSFAPHEVAARHGADWVAFLNRTAPGGPPFDARTAEAVYRGDVSAIDAGALHRAALHWLREHRRPA